MRLEGGTATEGLITVTHWFITLLAQTSVPNPVPVVDNNDPMGFIDMFKTLGGFGLAAYLLIQQKSLLTSIKDNLMTLTALVASRSEDDRRKPI